MSLYEKRHLHRCHGQPTPRKPKLRPTHVITLKTVKKPTLFEITIDNSYPYSPPVRNPGVHRENPTTVTVVVVRLTRSRVRRVSTHVCDLHRRSHHPDRNPRTSTMTTGYPGRLGITGPRIRVSYTGYTSYPT